VAFGGKKNTPQLDNEKKDYDRPLGKKLPVGKGVESRLGGGSGKKSGGKKVYLRGEEPGPEKTGRVSDCGLPPLDHQTKQKKKSRLK